MSKKWLCAGVAAVSMVALAGCPEGWDEGPKLTLLSVSGNEAWCEYHPRWSGWEVLSSALYRLDLTTGTFERALPRTRQFGLQAAGDFYVTEEPFGDNSRGRILGGRISTRTRTVLHERDVDWTESFWSVHALSGARVAVLAETELFVFDLAAGEEVQRVTVPAATALVAYDGARAIVLQTELPEYVAYLVDLNAAETAELPAMPAGVTPYWVDAQLVGDWVVASGWETASLAPRLLALADGAPEWEVLAEYPASDVPLMPATLLIGAGDAEQVLVEFLGLEGDLRIGRLELVVPATGEVAAVATRTGLNAGTWLDAALEGDTAYWLSSDYDELLIRDLVSGAARLLPLHGPGD